MEMWAPGCGRDAGLSLAGARRWRRRCRRSARPPASLAGLAGLVTTPLTDLVSQAVGAVSTAAPRWLRRCSRRWRRSSPALSSVTSLISSAPVSSLTSVAQIGMYPASMLMSPIMMVAQGAGHAGSGAGRCHRPGRRRPRRSLAAPVYGLQPVSGLGALGVSAGLGKARLGGGDVGAADVARVDAPLGWSVRRCRASESGLPTAAATAGTAGPRRHANADGEEWFGRDDGPRRGESACGAVTAQRGAANRGRIGSGAAVAVRCAWCVTAWNRIVGEEFGIRKAANSILHVM